MANHMPLSLPRTLDGLQAALPFANPYSIGAPPTLHDIERALFNCMAINKLLIEYLTNNDLLRTAERLGAPDAQVK